MLHYHGTPITPKWMLGELAGRSFCVSFADPRDIEFVHEIGQSVMLDNGAYTVWSTGTPTDWPAYYSWCERWLEYHTTWAVIPDIIDGDEHENNALLEDWPFGVRGAPVWHMHESLNRLQRLCAQWPRVCIGSSRQYSRMTSPAWHQRMAAAMDVACVDGLPTTWLHLLRGLAMCGSDYPLSSADSTNIARNHAGSRRTNRPPRSVRTMAEEIDSHQCPARWRPAPDQLELALTALSADDV